MSRSLTLWKPNNKLCRAQKKYTQFRLKLRKIGDYFFFNLIICSLIFVQQKVLASRKNFFLMKIVETNLSKGSKSFNPKENQEVDTCCDTAPIFNLTFND